MQILAKLFGSQARVKILRLFLMNPVTGFETKDVLERSKVKQPHVRKEISFLESIGLIKKRPFTKETEKSGKIVKKKVQGYFLDASFPYLDSLRTLLLETEFVHKSEIASRFKPAGKIKLLVIAGIFIQDEESRVDLMIVGDNLKRNVLENAIRMLESEIGKELTYAIFDTKDFGYRLSMYDKLVRDVLDFPHEKIIDTTGLALLKQV